MFLKYVPSLCAHCEDASNSVHKVKASVIWGCHSSCSQATADWTSRRLTHINQLDASPAICSLSTRKRVGISENQEPVIANTHSQKQGHPAGVPGRGTWEDSCVSCSQGLSCPMTSENPVPCTQWSLNQDRLVLLFPPPAQIRHGIGKELSQGHHVTMQWLKALLWDSPSVLSPTSFLGLGSRCSPLSK